KEDAVARHQTGRNSGVIHSGVYYRPGSLKARNCREGKRALVDFCREEGIPYRMCGKVIVAVHEDERPGLHEIHRRAQVNGIECALIGPDRLREIEPHAAGIEALHVPDAGIVDYAAVARRLAERLVDRGPEVRTNAEVVGIVPDSDRVTVETLRGTLSAGHVITCAGLYADRIARLSGEDPEMLIIPFRGAYFELKPHARKYCRTLIYPVPDPAFPFLGVHFTSMIDGGVECGPNAVLAFAREGYRFSDVNIYDLRQTLAFSGFRRLAVRHWRKELYEMIRSLSKRAFVRTLRRLVPEIQMDDLEPAPAGVRAQAVLPNGDLADDFVIRPSHRVLNVCNAPSPAAT